MRRKKLVQPWKSISTAIFLIGLAILFSRGQIFPGILVLIAITTLVEAGIQILVPSAAVERVRWQDGEEVEAPAPPAQEARGTLPAVCLKCGGPLSPDTVKWVSPKVATCPYCATPVETR
ncbi:MAG: hypothetical protein EXR62_04015 [Chloroflexi bacterium]|nr:hypothetical protein [Chloroflexota bacterium]